MKDGLDMTAVGASFAAPPARSGRPPARWRGRARGSARSHHSLVPLVLLLAAGVFGVRAALGVVHTVAPSPPDTSKSAAASRKPAPETAHRTPEIQDLKTRLDLKEPFNLARGKVRILVFFSPTCSHCIANANGLQQLVLDKLKTTDIEVYAVWLKILDTDDRQAVVGATTILHDERVHHYWDPNSVVNAQLLDAIMFDIQLRLYNIELLYDRTAVWDKRLPRPPYWMQEYRGAPGPIWDAATFADEVLKALENKPLDAPVPR